jgi:hypothetical protein
MIVKTQGTASYQRAERLKLSPLYHIHGKHLLSPFWFILKAPAIPTQKQITCAGIIKEKGKLC